MHVFGYLFLLTGSIVTGNTISTDYRPTYFSSPDISADSNIFSTYFDSNTHLNTFSTINECKSSCSNLTNCLGFVEVNPPQPQCILLNNLGIPQPTNLTSVSFTKYSTYDNRDNHSISGYYFYGNEEYGENVIHTVYIDLNHNGIWDTGEPKNTTVDNAFVLSNISAGNYLVREIQDDECIQFWPGAWGDSIIYNGQETNYVDSVVQYYHDGHPTNVEFNGGVIIDPSTPTIMNIPNAQVSLILGNSPSTFLSFESGYGIILAFLNEVIENGEGSDIIINTIGSSTTNAKVSVSYNNVDYTTIGILNDTHNSFDLANENYTSHVAFVKLDFFNENTSSSDTRNIISVQGVTANDNYWPPYASYVTVPQTDNVIFVKDCHYYYQCYTYCVFTRLTFDEIDSCMVGCDLWEETGTCMCEDYNTTDVPFYGDVYRKNDCDDGCTYRIKHEVYPEYDVKMHASGLPNAITSTVNCQEYDITGLSPNGCILDAIDSCSRQPTCEAISLDNHIDGYLYTDHHYVDEENSYFIVKNSEYRNRSLVRYTTQTTTQTTSETSTVTTSETSTQTTTQSITATTTQTSSQTTTQSITPTTTQTLTPTSTPTTSQTTQTSIEESEQSTSVRDGFLIALAVIVIMVMLFVGYRVYRKTKFDKKNNNSGGLTETHEPYVNPVYDGQPGSRLTPTTPPLYLDVSSEFTEGPPSVSPTSFARKSPIQRESNV